MEQTHDRTAEVLSAGNVLVTVIELPGGGAGSISRNERLSHPKLAILAEQAERKLVDSPTEYLEPPLSDKVTRCGDGRGAEQNNGGCQAFGGTAGLIKSRILAGEVSPGIRAEDTIGREVALRSRRGLKSGGHRADTHGNEQACGCGECDGAQAALSLYLEHEEALKPLVVGLWQELGLQDKYGEFSGNLELYYQDIIATTRELLARDYFINGAAQIAAVESNATEENSIEQLIGPHKEVLWYINTIDDTSFAQERFLQSFDSNQSDSESGIQTFWEDQWAITRELEQLYSANTKQITKTLVADLVRRVATATNLTKADLKLLINKGI